MLERSQAWDRPACGRTVRGNLLGLSWPVLLMGGVLIGVPLFLGVSVFAASVYQGNREALVPLFILLFLASMPLGLYPLAILGRHLMKAFQGLPLEQTIERAAWCGLAIGGIFLSVDLLLIQFGSLETVDFYFVVPYVLYVVFDSMVMYCIARKLRLYPAQNAAQVVVKLRKMYGEPRTTT